MVASDAPGTIGTVWRQSPEMMTVRPPNGRSTPRTVHSVLWKIGDCNFELDGPADSLEDMPVAHRSLVNDQQVRLDKELADATDVGEGAHGILLDVDGNLELAVERGAAFKEFGGNSRESSGDGNVAVGPHC